MKLFFHGLFVCLTLLAGVIFTGCGTPSNNEAFFMDTPQRQSKTDSSANEPTGVESLLPQAPPPEADVARFRVGQTVMVTFAGPPEPVLPFEEVIKEDGSITMPLIGRIYAVGKTAGELQNEIYTNYVPQYYVHLDVTVKSGDRVFYVGGEVGHAGVFQYISDTTVTKAIQAAGGLTPYSSHSNIWLVHAGSSKRIRVNYDKALQDPDKDPPVYPDDQISVDRSIW
jgi:protein involved in polysaccharide export with SLBB domain